MAPMLQRFEGCVLVGWSENQRTFTGAPPIFHRKVQTNAWNNKIALERNVFLFFKAWLGKMPSEKMWAPSRNMAPTIPMESQGLDPLVQSHVVSCCSLQPIHWPYDRKWSFGGWFQTCFIVNHCSSINDGTQWLKFEMGWNHQRSFPIFQRNRCCTAGQYQLVSAHVFGRNLVIRWEPRAINIRINQPKMPMVR